jgi:hypothetical protein
MAARKTRLNFTLSPENVRAAQEIAEERGLKLSTFVDRAIAAYVRQLREPAKLAPASPGTAPSIDYKRWESQVTGLIPRALETYLEGHYGDNDLKRLVEMWTAAAIEQSAPPTPPAGARTSTRKASRPGTSVDVPPELVERLRKFSGPQLMEATGLDRSSVSHIRTGTRNRLRAETYEKVLRGLEQLEAGT